jgi:hypothetical protein
MTEFINKDHPTSIDEFRICHVSKEDRDAVQQAIDREVGFVYTNLQQIQDRRLLNKYINMENGYKMEGFKICIPEAHSERVLQKYEKEIKGANLIVTPLIVTLKKQETKNYR